MNAFTVDKLRSTPGPWLRHRAVRSAAVIALGLAAVAASYSSAFRVPLYSDDFLFSQHFYNINDGSIVAAIASGWDDQPQAGRFNPTGREFAAIYHVTAHAVAQSTDITLQASYRLGSLLLIILACAAGGAALLQCLAFASNRRTIRFPMAFALVSLFTAMLFQISPWSNDASITISEIGWGTPALSMLFIALGFWAQREPLRYRRRILPLVLVGVGGVLFYETFVAAVAAIALLYFARLVSNRGRPQQKAQIALFVSGIGLPMIVFVLARLYGSMREAASSYQGTELELSATGFKTLLFYLLGAAPGGSWLRSFRHTQSINLTVESIATGLVLVAIVTGLALLVRKSPRKQFKISRPWMWPAVVLCIYLIGATSMVSFNAKYIPLIQQVGDTYIINGLISNCFAVVGAGLAVVFAARAKSRAVVFALVLPLTGLFIMCQQSVNWSVATFESKVSPINARVNYLSLKPTPQEERCQALTEWVNTSEWTGMSWWQGYVDGVQKNYERHFGELFCAELPPELGPGGR
ncbi:MAG: hypothetical protein LBJ08_03920 [Bifidobacteriaceae bacterium]|jgi:hypothetical protein|nr:hypothetical protein [Bifidobacteriaceae bacterium]